MFSEAKGRVLFNGASNVMKYLDFIDLHYQPKETDIVCTFYVEPEGVTLEEAAGGVAAESSIGTWTELTTTKAYVEKLAARVFSLERNRAQIAYPLALFEFGNIPNIMSSISGNVFGMKTLANLKLLDIHLPQKLATSFHGPKFGITGIRKLLKVFERPLMGTIIKPKIGLNTSDHSKVAYEAWLGGCDIVKDDENLSSQTFNSFEDRVVETLESRDRAEKETGEKKVYMINVTAETEEMIKRAETVLNYGGEYIMVDIITCGFSAIQTLRNQNYDLVIHAHRAGHAAFTKNTKHGISMRVIALLSRIIGVDQLHVGTVVGKMFETKNEVLENIAALTKNLYNIKKVMPVASGGVHPGLVPDLIAFFGNNFIIQAGGGIHGHKEGTVAGAIAMRQAINATLEGFALDEYSKTHKELRIALKTWK